MTNIQDEIAACDAKAIDLQLRSNRLRMAAEACRPDTFVRELGTVLSGITIHRAANVGGDWYVSLGMDYPNGLPVPGYGKCISEAIAMALRAHADVLLRESKWWIDRADVFRGGMKGQEVGT